MSILKVARMGHPVLRQRGRLLEKNDLRNPLIQKLIDDMVETMHEYNGVGLAAPQVHASLRLFVALLVDDPARITREQAEQQVEELAGGMLAYVFASCDATLAKTSFVVELADQWVRSHDLVRRECGYGLLYEASKFSGKKAPSEEFFLAHVERIADTIGTESEKVRLSMGAALMGIGKRSAVLNEAALKVARDVGPIEFTSASGECEPFDVVKHLTTDRLKEKLGV